MAEGERPARRGVPFVALAIVTILVALVAIPADMAVGQIRCDDPNQWRSGGGAAWAEACRGRATMPRSNSGVNSGGNAAAAIGAAGALLDILGKIEEYEERQQEQNAARAAERNRICHNNWKQGDYHYRRGVELHNSHPETAIQWYERALQYFQACDDRKNINTARHAIQLARQNIANGRQACRENGNFHYRAGNQRIELDPEAAIKWYESAIATYERCNDQQGIATAKHAIQLARQRIANSERQNAAREQQRAGNIAESENALIRERERRLALLDSDDMELSDEELDHESNRNMAAIHETSRKATETLDNLRSKERLPGEADSRRVPSTQRDTPAYDPDKYYMCNGQMIERGVICYETPAGSNPSEDAKGQQQPILGTTPPSVDMQRRRLAVLQDLRQAIDGMPEGAAKEAQKQKYNDIRDQMSNSSGTGGSCKSYFERMHEQLRNNAAACMKETRLLIGAVFGPHLQSRGIIDWSMSRSDGKLDIKRDSVPELWSYLHDDDPRYEKVGDTVYVDCSLPITVRDQRESFSECARVYLCGAFAASCGAAVAEKTNASNCNAVSKACLVRFPIPQMEQGSEQAMPRPPRLDTLPSEPPPIGLSGNRSNISRTLSPAQSEGADSPFVGSAR